MEIIVAVRLNSFLELHSVIFPDQLGYRPGCITTHALISITQAINKTIDNQLFGCGVFIDLKKAFDTVNHDNTSEIGTLKSKIYLVEYPRAQFCAHYCFYFISIISQIFLPKLNVSSLQMIPISILKAKI